MKIKSLLAVIFFAISMSQAEIDVSREYKREFDAQTNIQEIDIRIRDAFANQDKKAVKDILLSGNSNIINFIIDKPMSEFINELVIEILRDDKFWRIPLVAGASGVGSQYHKSLVICSSVINRQLEDNSIEWDGVLTPERRNQIANQFKDYLRQKEIKSHKHDNEIEINGNTSPSLIQSDVAEDNYTKTQPLTNDNIKILASVVSIILVVVVTIYLYVRKK